MPTVNTFIFRLVTLPFCLVPLASSAADAPNKPQYGAWGFDSAGADPSTKPGDDFFRYANGTWIDKTQIPPDKPAYSLRIAMTDRTEQRLHDMMEARSGEPNDSPASLEDKVGAFYH